MTILWAGEGKSLTALATGGKLVSDRYRVTTEYIYIDRGLISTRGEQIPLWAVRDCDMSQSLVQRARGLSTLKITCEHNDFTGQKNVSLENIEGARELRDIINKHSKQARVDYETQQKAQNVTYSGATPLGSAVPAVDPIAQLEKLGELLSKGILSQEEFQAQKSKLLGL